MTARRLVTGGVPERIVRWDWEVPASFADLGAGVNTAGKQAGVVAISNSYGGGGSGCSTLNAALTAAASFDTGCAKRAMADVSAVADPARVSRSTRRRRPRRARGRSTAGRACPRRSSPRSTPSAATPRDTNAIPYGNESALFDVTSGSNGTCPTTQWCTARGGWDGPTGLGTPNGTAAF